MLEETRYLPDFPSAQCHTRNHQSNHNRCAPLGLGTVYAINAVLAVLAVFKAGERGQPALLWIAKTFSVGGLAYDQLTQLPTLEQIEEAKARKGKRALSKKKKQSLSKYN